MLTPTLVSAFVNALSWEMVAMVAWALMMVGTTLCVGWCEMEALKRVGARKPPHSSLLPQQLWELDEKLEGLVRVGVNKPPPSRMPLWLQQLVLVMVMEPLMRMRASKPPPL